MTQRVVLDTNVLVAAAYAPASASRRIVDACLEGEIVAVASPAVQREYERVLARAVRTEDYQQRLADFLERLELVDASETRRTVPDDREDDKFVAAAIAGHAGWLVTNDRHLLALDRHGGIRIVSSGTFAELVWAE